MKIRENAQSLINVTDLESKTNSWMENFITVIFQTE